MARRERTPLERLRAENKRLRAEVQAQIGHRLRLEREHTDKLAEIDRTTESSMAHVERQAVQVEAVVDGYRKNLDVARLELEHSRMKIEELTRDRDHMRERLARWLSKSSVVSSMLEACQEALTGPPIVIDRRPPKEPSVRVELDPAKAT